MNNRALTNLKFDWEVPGLGTFRIENASILLAETLKPLGWHTYSRAMVRKLVCLLRDIQGTTKDPIGPCDDDEDVIDDIRHYFLNRHNVPKGWHI